MHNDWVLIHTTSNNNTAQIVKGVLSNEGINAVIVNKRDTMHLHLNNASIEVYVQSNDVLKAKNIIEKNKL